MILWICYIPSKHCLPIKSTQAEVSFELSSKLRLLYYFIISCFRLLFCFLFFSCYLVSLLYLYRKRRSKSNIGEIYIKNFILCVCKEYFTFNCFVLTWMWHYNEVYQFSRTEDVLTSVYSTELRVVPVLFSDVRRLMILSTD